MDANGNGANSNGSLSDKVAVAALVIAVVAFLTTVVQLAQTIVASARGLPNCDARVMGKWAKYTSRKFRWRQLRLEIDFEAPVIFLSRRDNSKGPAGREVPIWYADGSRRSCDETRVEEPRPDGPDEGDAFNQLMIRERVHTVDNELASWVKLLGAIQKMERESDRWESGKWRQASLARPELEAAVTLAVGIQAKKRSFDANPTVKKPYATTTICHIVELAAVLGLYWKEFNRDQNKYRAEGNGYSLLGTRLDDFGIVFIFEKCGWSKFQESRIIPTSEVKELCFGNAPTFYRDRNPVADEAWNAPVDEQKTLQTLRLGSRDEIAETLNLIGCNTTTALYYRREKKHAHLFPVTFEILGMLCRTLHVKDRCYTYLPNPTIFPWQRQAFSLRRMLDEFHKHMSQNVAVFSREGFTLPPELEQISALAGQLNRELPNQSGQFSPPHLNLLHEALDHTDGMLAADRIDKDVVLDVLRRHIQEVMLAINTTADQVASGGRATSPTTPVALADISFDDLLGVPPENREREFMKKYFAEIRHRVISTDSTDHHDPQAADASRTIHAHSAQQKEQTAQQEKERQGAERQQQQQQQQQWQQWQPPPPPPPGQGPAEEVAGGDASPSATGNPKPLSIDMGVPGTRAGTMRLARRVTSFGTKLSNAFELRRNNIWCTLVFRMLCWLLLHDFDKRDVQLGKSELLGSRLPVYIM